MPEKDNSTEKATIQTSSTQNLAAKAIKRFIVSFFVELVPFLGDMAPMWSWAIFSTFKAKKGVAGLIDPGFLIFFPAAVMIDLFGIVLFILSLFEVGIGLSWISDAVGAALVIFVSGWMILEDVMEKAAKKIVS